MDTLDMNDHRILSRSEYELSLARTLARIGLGDALAESVIQGRWSNMNGAAVILECCGRGLLLTLDDLTAFLLERYAPRTTFPDGAPIDADGINWGSWLIDPLLDWAVANCRGTFADDDEADPPAPSLRFVSMADMLAGLRSEDASDRIAAGCALGASLGVGLKLDGETVEDFELILAPQLSTLLGRAMAGDLAAVVELGELVTNDPSATRNAMRAKARRAGSRN
jgi:hypothetical protein